MRQRQARGVRGFAPPARAALTHTSLTKAAIFRQSKYIPYPEKPRKRHVFSSGKKSDSPPLYRVSSADTFDGGTLHPRQSPRHVAGAFFNRACNVCFQNLGNTGTPGTSRPAACRPCPALPGSCVYRSSRARFAPGRCTGGSPYTNRAVLGSRGAGL